MTVYIDVLLLENFIINSFLLIATTRVLKFNYKRSVYLAALLGSVYTLIIFLKIPIFTSFVSRVIVALVMLYISLEIKNIKNLMKSLVTFFMISFVLSGVCFSFVIMQNQYVIGEEFRITNSSIKYTIIALMALYIVIVRIAAYFKERALIKNLLYDIEISHNKEKFYVKGFLDTGNELKEPVTNLPCIIVEGKYLQEINIEESKFFYIRYKTIGDEGKLKGFKGELVRIKNENEDWRTVEAVICSCTNKLSKENEYNALLSRGII